MADVEKLQFLSADPIDKIVQQGSITIVNDGDTTGQPLTFQEAKIVEDTVDNEYGRAGLIRASWSTDGGTNYQAMEAQTVYSFTIGAPFNVTLPGLDSAISVGCTDGTITFRTANGRHGNVNGVTFAYTPTSRTFDINYWVYERE